MFSKIRLAEDSKEDLIKQLFNQYNINDLPMCYAKVLVFFDNKIDRLIPYFKKINNTILAGYVNLLIDESKNMKKDLIEFLLENSSKIRTNDYQTNRVYVKSANVILLKLMEEAKNQNKPLCEQGKKIFNLYLEKGFDCLEYIYDVRKLRMIYSTLAIQEDKFFMIMYLVQDAVEKERFSSGIKYIREALKQFPHMAIALQEYQKEVFKI